MRSGLARRPVVLITLVMAAVTGCQDRSAVIDANDSVDLPVMPERLWSVKRPPAPAGRPSPPPVPAYEPEPLPGLSLAKDADARSLDPRTVIAKDPGVSDASKRAAATCRPGCGLREPVLRDITGDGRPELLLLVDQNPGAAETGAPGESAYAELYVYRVENGRVLQLLGLAADAGTSVDLQGRDLIVRQVRPDEGHGMGDQASTDRYRWNDASHTLESISSVLGPAPSASPELGRTPAKGTR
ncbi:hypothetical protein [Streptomyces sp. NPDC002851]